MRGFPDDSDGKKYAWNAEHMGLIPGLERSLGWKDPMEEGMVTHSSILAWRIPWTEEPGGLPSIGLQRVGHDWATSLVHRVAKSRTWLKRLSKHAH